MLGSFGGVLALGVSPDGGSPWLQFVPFILVLGIFYFIILLPMKRKQQKVQLQIADKVRIDVAKAAIGGYQGQPPVVESQTQS